MAGGRGTAAEGKPGRYADAEAREFTVAHVTGMAGGRGTAAGGEQQAGPERRGALAEPSTWGRGRAGKIGEHDGR